MNNVLMNSGYGYDTTENVLTLAQGRDCDWMAPRAGEHGSIRILHCHPWDRRKVENDNRLIGTTFVHTKYYCMIQLEHWSILSIDSL